MHVLPCLLRLLSAGFVLFTIPVTACLALFTDRAQCMFGQVYLACSVQVVQFTEHAHVLPCY